MTDQMSKPKILCCVLCGTERQNWINPELSVMLFKMGRDPRFDVEVVNVKNAHPVEFARNHTIRLARDYGFDWLVSFDNDNFLQTGTPLDIIAAAGTDKHIIGFPCAIAADDSKFRIYPEVDGASGSPFQEAESVGGGVLMVNRQVWERIPAGPWFRWQHGEDTETLGPSTGGCGEDVYFCRLARSRGLKIWTHRQLAGHYRTANVTEMVSTIAQLSRWLNDKA
jgi:hypothetical protein